MKPGEKLKALIDSKRYGTATELARALNLKTGYSNIYKWCEGRGFDGNHRVSVGNRRAVEEVWGLPAGYFDDEAEGDLAGGERVDTGGSEDIYPSRARFIAETRLLPDEHRHLMSLWYAFGDPGAKEWGKRLRGYQFLKENAATLKPAKNLARPPARSKAGPPKAGQES